MKISALGNTNKNRWDIFSVDNEMSVMQFSNRLQALGLNVSPQYVATLWRATGINTDRMQFGDFIKFLQATSIKNTTDSDNFLPISISNVLNTNKRQLLSKIIESDPKMTGFISYRALSEALSWFGLESRQDILQLAQKYDPDDSGNFRYFQFFSDLCYGDSVPTVPPTSSRAPAPPIDVSFARSPERDISTDSYSYSSRSYQPSSPKSPPSARSNYDDTQSRFSIQNEYQSSSSGGRGKLDPAIFGQRSQGTGSSGGGRGKLDPAIFGQKPTIQAPPEQPVFNADECKSAERVEGLTPAQLIELISKQVGRLFKTSKHAYNKWRGNNDVLTSDDLRNGLAREANILISKYELEIIMGQYGGPLRLSSFVRMLSDGSNYAEQHKSVGGMRKTTEDEAALIRIAEQLSGNEWEEILLKSNSMYDVARGLAALGVETSMEELTSLSSKLGKTGLYNSLKSRIQ